MRALVWFRRDLRIDDNAALSRAASASDGGVVGVFLVSLGQWREHDDAPIKIDFWMRNVAELSRSLAKLRIPLIVAQTETFDDAPGALLKIAREHGCGALHFNEEYEVNERRRDEAVRERLEGEGVAVHAWTDRVVLAPGEVRTKDGGYFKVFTPFKRAWIARLENSPEFETHDSPRRQAETGVASTPLPERRGAADKLQGAELWPAGESEANRRLDEFVARRIANYKRDRDIPAIDGTSALSPYLAAGVISVRRCVRAAAEVNGGRLESAREGPSTWISELVWREFYTHALIGFPRVSRGEPFQLETRRVRWRDDDEGFEAWREGRTGYPIVDAAMRSMLATGWMHNRLRMVSAMFLSKHLLIDWRRGERHFMRHLVDGDLAANNGGWQWSASTGMDAAPYFRVFNPTSQSERFDAEGEFIRRYCPELEGFSAKEIHDPPALARSAAGYPAPIVDHGMARSRAIEAFKV